MSSSHSSNASYGVFRLIAMKKPKSTKPRPTHKIKTYAEWDKSVPREVHFMCIYKSGICYLDQTYNFSFVPRGKTCWFQKCALAQQKSDLLHVKWFPARQEVLQCRLEHTGERFHVWFLLGVMHRTVYWMWDIFLMQRKCRSCSGSLGVTQPEGLPFCTIRMSLTPGDLWWNPEQLCPPALKTQEVVLWKQQGVKQYQVIP